MDSRLTMGVHPPAKSPNPIAIHTQAEPPSPISMSPFAVELQAATALW